jgi:hypothetical protein
MPPSSEPSDDLSVSVDVSNTCTCMWCNSCDWAFVSTDGTCPDCRNDGSSIEHCDGSCYDTAVELFDELWDATFDGRPFVAEWGGAGWLRGRGTAIVAHGMDAEAARKRLTFNGDWRLNCKFTADRADIVRYSHDEPTGATFTFHTLTVDQQRIFDALVEDGLDDDDLVEAFNATRSMA